MTNSADQRIWTYPYRLLRDHRLLRDTVTLTFFLWAGSVVAVAALIVIVAAFRTIEISGWEQFAQIPQFWVAFIGGYLTYSLLPTYVTHGQTRRDFAIQSAVFIPIFAAISGALVTVGYALEWALYSINDWPQDLQNQHVFSSPTELQLVFVEYGLVFLTWTAVGAMVGAAFYGSGEAGLASLGLALIPVSLTGMFVRSEWGPVTRLLDVFFDTPLDIPLAVAILVSIVASLIALAMAWLFVRDVPIRSASS